MRTLELILGQRLVTASESWPTVYGVTIEVVGTVSSGTGWLVRYHADTFVELRDFLYHQYGSSAQLHTDEQRNSWAWKLIDRRYASYEPLVSDTNTEGYDEFSDLAVSLMTNAGISPFDKDVFGNYQSDLTQTLLTEVLLRAPQLAELLGLFDVAATKATQNWIDMRNRAKDEDS